MATLSFVACISTAGFSIRLALRMRVSMSAIGSVIMCGAPLLPRGLGHAGNLAVGGQPPEADAADAELAVDAAAAAADLAPQPDLDPLPGRHQLGRVPLRFGLGHLRPVLVQFRRLALEPGLFRVRR